MITNIIQMLHTTAAYQSAVMQLMVGEANFFAKQMDLRESVPVVAVANTNEWEIEPPPSGIGGTVTSSNYTFWFHEGKIRSINRYDWLKKITPPVNQFWELSKRPSLLDTNTAYQLATQWLAAISVDVQELERKHPPRIFQVPAWKTDADGQSLRGISNTVALPLYLIGWGESAVSVSLREELRTNPPPGNPNRPSRPFRERMPDSDCPVFVELLGTTKELIELDINDSTLVKRPALQLTNTAELLGTPPPPRHFVEELVGGKEAYGVIANPDKVEAWLISSASEAGGFDKKKERAGPQRLTAKMIADFSEPLLNFDSYSWGYSGKRCMADFGAKIRFSRGRQVVEVMLCYECNILQVSFGGKETLADFDSAHNKLVKAIQAVFPNDAAIKKL